MKLLFLTHRVPYAPNRGDRIRAFHMLRYLKAAGISVCLVALAHDGDEVTEASRLSGVVDTMHVVRVSRGLNLLAAAVGLATDRPLTHALLDSPRMGPLLDRVLREFGPDAVLAYCSGMARFAMSPPLDTLPFVLDMVDVDSFKWEALAETSHAAKRWVYRREARVLRRFEANATRAASSTLVVSRREQEALRGLDPAFAPVVLPNGVDVASFRNAGPPAAGPEVVFTGVFSYQPNEAGAFWLMDEVWPHVQGRRPDAHLTLVGSGATAALRQRAERAGARVTGAVPDVRPYLWSAAVAVAPVHTARGVQNKVLEAVAAGLPAVVTTAVGEGLPDEIRPACVVATDARAFATAVADLLELTPAERQARAHRALLHELSWERTLAPLGDILAGIVERRAARDAKRELAHAPA
jgi:polysaccharide biosynthesis protein PslH